MDPYKYKQRRKSTLYLYTSLPRGRIHIPFGPFFCEELRSTRHEKKGSPQLNANELARDKFNALFTAHDAKDKRADALQQKIALKAGERATHKKVKRNTRGSDIKSDSKPQNL